MKKFARKVRTSMKLPSSVRLPSSARLPSSVNPLYLVAGAVVLVLLVVVVVIFAGGSDVVGGGDDDESSSDAARGFAEGDRSRLPGAETRPVKEAPRVRTGKLDEAKREGRLAVAQARGTIVSPSRVSIRVSAAPKQTVRVNYQLGCFKDRHARIGMGEYRTRAPNVRSVGLPTQGAQSCIVTASAQLTRSDRSGRIKVAVYSGG